jgi:hypothetical protein
MEKEKDLAQEIYNQFQDATSFIDAENLRRDIKRCVNFEEGKQWNTDEDIEDFPKIVLNIIKQIGKVRKSNVLQNDYGFLVNSTKFKSVRKIQDFIKYLHDKLKIKKKDLKVINDTYKKGTGVMYFYWDAEARSLFSRSGGRLKAEPIDIRRFRVADPYIQELQDQEYVIYVTRERINSIEKKYNVTGVVPDSEEYTVLTERPVATDEFDKEFANVYTKFYRNKHGQVFFAIATPFKVLKGPTPLNPFYEEEDSEEEPNTMSVMDEKENTRIENEVFHMFPFVSLVFEERDNCFYGIPGALEIIEAQKSINQHFSVFDKGTQDNVLGGFVFKRGILGEQEITTENGQILQLDLLPGENWQNVFGRIPVNNIPADSMNYSGNLLGVIRQVSGATNIQVGSSDYSGQSGKQTEMLLQRAKENSSDMAMLFNEYKREQAELLFLFSKFYYDNEDFSIIEHGFQEDKSRIYKGENNYNGNEYIGEEIMFDVKVGPAPSFSEYANIELLGMMVQSGQAPLEVYIASLPEGYISNKQELLKLLKDNSRKVIQNLEQQLEQSQQVMEQMNKAFKEMKKDVSNLDKIINENDRLKSMLGELAAKGIDISKEAAAENRELTKDIQRLLSAINKGSSETSN